MKFSMLIKSSLLSLRVNKMRVFLTMIGIIIGISSVVTILSVGAGLQQEVGKSVQQTDVNSFVINFKNNTYNPNVKPFDKTDFKILKQIDGVLEVTEDTSVFNSDSSFISEARYFDKNAKVMIKQYKDEKLNLLTGRLINEEDNAFKNKVVVITRADAKVLFGDEPQDAIGKGIDIKGNFFEIIGVIKDSSISTFSMNFNYIPDSAKDYFTSETSLLSINVRTKQGYNIREVFKDVKSELERLHLDLSGEYTMADPQDIIKAFQSIIGGITAFIAVVSGISLFVSGVGVMNIMYVSVSERKREIGIRRAMGAKSKTIMLQFLIEAVMITFIGGLIGLVVGYIISLIVGIFIPFKPVMTMSIALGASITSIITGIIFGVIPANKASKLSPINAIYK